MIQRLRELPIEGVAERLQLSVKKHKCLCPFHDDEHPSLSFNSRRNSYRCFVCGAHGGTIDLTMHLLGKEFAQACHWLAEEYGIQRPPHSPLKGDDRHYARPSYGHTATAQPSSCTSASQQPADQPLFDPSRYARFFEHPTLSPEACRFLYDERHLDPRVVSWCRLTSWTDRQGIHWLQIPYYDPRGQLIGLQSRNLDNESPRFRFPRGSRCTIYNLQVLPLLRQDEPLYITEGCSDCWAMLSSGHKAIAIPSATLLQPHDTLTLQALARDRGTTFHMYPDRDAPGERLFLQLRELLPDLQHHQLPPGCKDYAEAFVKLKTKN